MRGTTGSEQLFWSEIKSKDSTRRSVAICYAMLIADHTKSGKAFWFSVNQAVIMRFKIKTESELLAFQTKAKKIYVAAAAQICPAFHEDEKEGKAAENVT